MLLHHHLACVIASLTVVFLNSFQFSTTTSNILPKKRVTIPPNGMSKCCTSLYKSSQWRFTLGSPASNLLQWKQLKQRDNNCYAIHNIQCIHYPFLTTICRIWTLNSVSRQVDIAALLHRFVLLLVPFDRFILPQHVFQDSAMPFTKRLLSRLSDITQ